MKSDIRFHNKLNTKTTKTLSKIESKHTEIVNQVQHDSFLTSHLSVSANEDTDDNWLISYADMMTLLFGFFVLIMSFSKIDVESFEKTRHETSEFFGGEYKAPFEKMKSEVQAEIKSQKLNTQVVMTINEKGAVISFRGALFFETGSYEVREEARILLRKIIPIVKKQNSQFTLFIEGHTDDNPINDKQFKSNWELSSYRAISVLHIFEKEGFPSSNLRAIGYGDTQPILPNRNENGVAIIENQNQNRRVVLRFLHSKI